MRRLAALVVAAACVLVLPGAVAVGRPAGPGECSGHDHGRGNGKGHDKGRGKGHDKGRGKGHDRHCGDDPDGGGDGGGTGGNGPDGGIGPSAPGAPGVRDVVADGTPGGTGGGAAQDAVAPSLSRPTLSVTVFRAARRGPAISTPVGTRVRYTLSEPARVRFTVLKARLTVRRCAHADRGAHASRHRRCIRYRRLGRFTHRGAVGANSFRFRGRVNGRRLSPGRYRLVSRAIDAGGNRSRPRRVRFQIVR